MGIIFVFFFLFLLTGEGRVSSSSEFNRNNFPHRFVFGSSSSAYQYEGAWREGGKVPSICDTFVHNRPDLIYDGSNGDVALDSYHRYKEDVALMKNMNMDAYKFSIAWSRVLPTGTLRGGINRESIQHYNNLINELLSKGVQPFVTLFHWDFPQGLEDEYEGFLSPRIVDDFRDYAEVCFKEFGDRVRHWITINEPWTFTLNGYATGTLGPGRCSPFQFGHCITGDSSREPYRASHHMILAHAAAVKLYRDKYQASQKGQIGITLNTHWFMPYSNAKVHRDATARSLDFMFGFYMDPLTQGHYPLNMRTIVGDRLPRFNSTESEMVKGSFDFIGLNYYTTYYCKSISLFTERNVSFDTDTYSSESGFRDGIPIGPQGASEWLFSYPPGIRDILHYIKNKYNNPIIYITENGIDEINNATLPLEEALKDDFRIDYHQDHLLFVDRAIKEGVDVRGYFVWSLFDNFEWSEGYTVRFGINYVDFKNDLKRYPKRSALWFRKFLQRRRKSYEEIVHILSHEQLNEPM